MREFLEVELKESRLDKFFTRVFSSTSDFNQVRKSVSYYRKVCDILKVKPNQMLHIGDNRKFDFEIPLKTGIKALLIDRDGKTSGKKVIHSLKELEDILNDS